MSRITFRGRDFRRATERGEREALAARFPFREQTQRLGQGVEAGAAHLAGGISWLAACKAGEKSISSRRAARPADKRASERYRVQLPNGVKPMGEVKKTTVGAAEMREKPTKQRCSAACPGKGFRRFSRTLT